jgi:hypothetical protein
MKNVVLLGAVAVLSTMSTIASATPDPRYCQMVSSLAKKIAEDRDKGVTYKAELRVLKSAIDGTPSSGDIYKMAQGMAKIIYVDNPKLTPEGAFKLHYVVCMSAK